MFITFEGIDFCGKSTQVNLLKKYLEDKNKDVKLIREPGGTDISEKIREILLDKSHEKMFIETEVLLFSASRAQLVREVIQPYLKENIYVISDRFHDSTIAYQGFGRSIPLDFIRKINEFAIGGAIPDLTFIIDISIEESGRRKSQVKKELLDRIELSEINFYKKVRDGYLYLAGTEKRFKILDGMLSIKEIHEQIINEIKMIEKIRLEQ